MFRRRDRRDNPKTTAASPEPEADVVPEELDKDELEELEDRPEYTTADLESQAADYLADNDAWMYGPNAEAVLEILDQLEEIGPEEARPLSEAWLAIPKSDRERARRAARKLAETDEDIARYLQLVREAVGTWMAVTGPYPEFVNAEPDWGRLCAQTGEAAQDAATAVILEDKIEERHFEALIEPWSETMAQLEAASDAARLERDARGEVGGPDEEEDVEAEEEEEKEDENKFGPNSDSIADFLNRLWLLTPEQIGRLVSGWKNVDRDQLKAAHERLQAVVDEDPEWREQVRHAQDELGPWLNAGRLEDTAGFLGQAGQGESRKMAGPALADAAAALVLADLLERKDAETLYGPWFNVIGGPPLPVATEEAEAPSGGTAARGAKPVAKAKPPAANELRGAAKPNVLKKR
ncbi:MAG: hypothetical protein ABSB75_01785 [Candidatus Limnocylindrales bacterium]